ncbi:MAG: hypothetical protein IBX50_09330 [Marinospirillum sp.]|uniref:hypothetical protein n=1 Tax=Marinospirillum sp. TaxID=2183934 RepID=UPI001A0ED9A9|nr:hypothetical protein [Marinospirillum sp.]MBE0506903.1 hypothetical protein [Marinospirillum sp.]
MSKVSWSAIYIHAAMFIVLIAVLSFRPESPDVEELQGKIECLEKALNDANIKVCYLCDPDS